MKKKEDTQTKTGEVIKKKIKTMKKILILISLFFSSYSIWNGFDEELIHTRIDSIFDQKNSQLISLNQKLPDISKQYTWEKKELILHIHMYLNFKFKNKGFYAQTLSQELQDSTRTIETVSFTEQEEIIALKNIQANYKDYSIEYEYINYLILISEVGIALHHQDFTEARSISKSFFSGNTEKIDFFIKNSSYSIFSTLTQLASWHKPEAGTSMIAKRIEFYPQEAFSAYNMVRKNNFSYTWLDCDLLTIIDENQDIPDLKHCKLWNDSFEDQDLEDLETLDNNLQNLSDRIIYYSYIQTLPGYSDAMLEKKEVLSKQILSYDIHFINAYLVLLSVYDVKNECDAFDSYTALLEENYKWDEERKINTFNRSYSNCWK